MVGTDQDRIRFGGALCPLLHPFFSVYTAFLPSYPQLGSLSGVARSVTFATLPFLILWSPPVSLDGFFFFFFLTRSRSLYLTNGPVFGFSCSVIYLLLHDSPPLFTPFTFSISRHIILAGCPHNKRPFVFHRMPSVPLSTFIFFPPPLFLLFCSCDDESGPLFLSQFPWSLQRSGIIRFFFFFFFFPLPPPPRVFQPPEVMGVLPACPDAGISLSYQPFLTLCLSLVVFLSSEGGRRDVTILG